METGYTLHVWSSCQVQLLDHPSSCFVVTASFVSMTTATVKRVWLQSLFSLTSNTSVSMAACPINGCAACVLWNNLSHCRKELFQCLQQSWTTIACMEKLLFNNY